MALTLQLQEPFAGIGSLTAGSPGSNFGSVTGTLNKRARGPYPSGGSVAADGTGFSARLDAGANQAGMFSLTSGNGVNAAAQGFIGAWFYIDSTVNASNQCILMQALDSGGTKRMYLMWDPTVSPAQIKTAFSGQAFQSSTVGVSLRGHYWFGFEWTGWTSTPTTASAKFYLMSLATYLASGSPTLIATYTNHTLTTGPGSVGICNIPAGSGTFVSGRCGCPSLYSTGSYGDGSVYPPAIVAPTAPPFNWYCNPGSGNDNNDGTTPSTAWASLAKLNAESANCGMFGGYTSGSSDFLFIDTSGAPLVQTSTMLNFQTSCLTVQPPAGWAKNSTYWTLQAWKDISGVSTTWTLNSGIVWQTSDGSAPDLLDVAVWEDDRWMNHPVAANSAAAIPLLQATPGSFWTDGTNIYMSTFESGNPNTDGHVYTRSRDRGGAGFNDAVRMATYGMQIWGLDLWKTAQVDNSNNAIATYGINYSFATQAPTVAGQTSDIGWCRLRYGANHLVGFTDANVLNRTINMHDCDVEQCAPWYGADPLVDYTTQTAATLVTNYTNITCNAGVGVIGSTAGSWTQDGTNPVGVWFSHLGTTGASNQFTITFTGCNFPGGTISCGGDTVSTMGVASLTVEDCMFVGSGGMGSPAATFDRCLITLSIQEITFAAASTIYTNCIIQQTQPMTVFSSNTRGVQGTVSFVGCTLDMTSAPSGSDTNGALLRRVAALTLTVENCVGLFNGAQDYTLLASAANTDTLNLSFNEYELGSSGVLLKSYAALGNQTFAQAQGLGFETGSVNDTALGETVAINPTTYRRTGAPPFYHSLGVLDDYTGQIFPTRQAPGAFELVGAGVDFWWLAFINTGVYVPPVPPTPPLPGNLGSATVSGGGFVLDFDGWEALRDRPQPRQQPKPPEKAVELPPPLVHCSGVLTLPGVTLSARLTVDPWYRQRIEEDEMLLLGDFDK